MPKQSYAFEPGGEKRLTIAWKGVFAFKDFTVMLDGNPLGTIPDKEALKTGQKFSLPDGSILKVKLIFGGELQLLCNGQPLPDSSSDPQAKLKLAAYMVFYIGGISLIIGITQILRTADIGFFPIIFGLVFLLLGFFVWRKSSVALILAIVIFSMDFLLSKFMPTAWGYTPGIGGLVTRIILFIPMIRGVGAIKALKMGNAPTTLP